MSKIKAVVLEKSGSRYTVLDQDGTFRQVHRRMNVEVGAEIEISSWSEYFSGVRIWSSAVALFLLVITSILCWNMVQAPTVVALLSVDINPSLQIEMDNQGHFVAFETQNEEAKRMLATIDLKGKTLEEVLGRIVSQAYEQKFLSPEQPWIVVGYSPMTNKTLEQMPKALNKPQIISWVTESGEKKGLSPQVAIFSLTSQERELAQKQNLTLGEYALWQTADKAGVVTQPEKLKDSSERVRLLENPRVQEQIKAEKDERQASSINKPVENDQWKLLPVGTLFVPIKVLPPWMDKSRSKARNQQDNPPKDQGNADVHTNNAYNKDKASPNASPNASLSPSPNASPSPTAKASEKDNTKEKDEATQKSTNQGDYQTKALNGAKDSEPRATQRVKYDKVYIPKIFNPGNLSHDTSHTYKYPKYDGDKQH